MGSLMVCTCGENTSCQKTSCDTMTYNKKFVLGLCSSSRQWAPKTKGVPFVIHKKPLSTTPESTRWVLESLSKNPKSMGIRELSGWWSRTPPKAPTGTEAPVPGTLPDITLCNSSSSCSLKSFNIASLISQYLVSSFSPSSVSHSGKWMNLRTVLWPSWTKVLGKPGSPPGNCHMKGGEGLHLVGLSP